MPVTDADVPRFRFENFGLCSGLLNIVTAVKTLGRVPQGTEDLASEKVGQACIRKYVNETLKVCVAWTASNYRAYPSSSTSAACNKGQTNKTRVTVKMSCSQSRAKQSAVLQIYVYSMSLRGLDLQT